MECATFSFGKYRGLPACDVPISYLVWATETMAEPHSCVMDELKRRAAQLGSREAIQAQAVVSALLFSKGRRKKAKRSGKKPVSRNMTGACYAEARAAWIAAGGDVSACPFDA